MDDAKDEKPNAKRIKLDLKFESKAEVVIKPPGLCIAFVLQRTLLPAHASRRNGSLICSCLLDIANSNSYVYERGSAVPLATYGSV